MDRALGLIGAPTSAGAFAPGQEKTPAVARSAGLIDRFNRAGIQVVDLGDTPLVRWSPDRGEPRSMNAEAVRASALEVAERVAQALDRGLMPLVLGGDCTVELGTVLGWQRRRDPAALVYFDPHADLNTPDTAPDGAFDWMGMAHLLGEAGARRELVDLGGRVPALAPDQVLLFGHDRERATPGERSALDRLGLTTVTQEDVVADPVGAAGRMLDLVGPDAPFLLHFDADAIDFADLPLAENTDRNTGLELDAAMAALTLLLASPVLGALTVTEINPDHGAEDGSTVTVFLDRLADALA